MRWGAFATIALLLPLVLADAPVGRSLYIENGLTVPAGETLTLLAGTKVFGPGHIDVFGSIESLGNDSQPSQDVEISVPILLAGNGTSDLQNTRIWGVSGTALTVRSGNLTLSNVTFEGNGIGLAVLAHGNARVTGDRVTFRAHASEGARIQGASAFTLSRANFSDNLRGLVLDLTVDVPTTARVNDSTFSHEGAHAEVALGSAPASVDVRFVSDDFGAITSPAGIARPGVLVHSDLASAPALVARNVTSVASRYHDQDVGVRLEGAGYHFTSQGDRFFANRIGLAASGAVAARVVGSSFDDAEKDIDASPDSTVATEGATFAAIRGASTPAAPPGVTVPWWLPGAALALAAVVGGGVMAGRIRRRRAAGQTAASAAAPPPELAPPLRAMERRVLEDILAHPGTAQAAVAVRLGLTRQALHYHVKKLEARRLLMKNVSGRESQCTVPPEVAQALALSPPRVTQAEDVEKR